MKRPIARQPANTFLEETLFHLGGNPLYIEQLHALYKIDPCSVDVEWQEFFGEPEDKPTAVKKATEGP